MIINSCSSRENHLSDGRIESEYIAGKYNKEDNYFKKRKDK